MATIDEEPIPETTKLPRKVWISILAGGAMLIAVPICYIYLSSLIRASKEKQATTQKVAQPPAKKAAQPPAERAPDARPPDGQNQHNSNDSTNRRELDPTPRVDSISLQEQALEQAKLLRLHHKAEQIQERWDQLSAASNELKITLASLLSDEVGRKVASSPELIDQFNSLRAKSAPVADDIEQFSGELKVLLQPLDSIQAPQIRSEFVAALEEIGNKIDDKLEAVTADWRLLEALTAVANRRTPIEITLNDAIERREREQAESRLEEIAAAAESARQAEVDKIAQETAENERKIVAAEAELKRIQEAKRLAELAEEKAAEEAVIAKAALEREFHRDLPALRNLLRPFITDGMTQPGRHTFEPVAEKGPVSFAKLQGANLLKPLVQSRAALYYQVSNNNDRDLGAFPRFFGGPRDVQSQQETMKRIQDFLNKYGELMVEKKMLAP